MISVPHTNFSHLQMVSNSQGTVSRVSQPLLCFCLQLGTWLTKFLKISTKKYNYCIDVNQKLSKTNFLCSNGDMFLRSTKKDESSRSQVRRATQYSPVALVLSQKKKGESPKTQILCLSFDLSVCLFIRHFACQSVCVSVYTLTYVLCFGLTKYLFISVCLFLSFFCLCL